MTGQVEEHPEVIGFRLQYRTLRPPGAVIERVAWPGLAGLALTVGATDAPGS